MLSTIESALSSVPSMPLLSCGYPVVLLIVRLQVSCDDGELGFLIVYEDEDQEHVDNEELRRILLNPSISPPPRSRKRHHLQSTRSRTPSDCARNASSGGSSMSRPRTKRLKFEPKNAELRPHPKLQGEYGLFAISTVEREGVLYKEEVPVVYELSSFLEGTDRYIAAEKGGKTTFILLKHESFISLSYRLNSSKAPKQGYNVLDRSLLRVLCRPHALRPSSTHLPLSPTRIRLLPTRLRL